MWTSSGRRVTLSFDPETDDRQTVLEAVDRAYAAVAGSTAGATTLDEDRRRPEPVPGAADRWTAEAMHDYVAALTPAARMVLFAVVTSLPATRDDARLTTQLGERAFERAWADLQDAVHRVPQVGRLPFDEVDGCLVADDEDADLAVRALNRIYDA